MVNTVSLGNNINGIIHNREFRFILGGVGPSKIFEISAQQDVGFRIAISMFSYIMFNCFGAVMQGTFPPLIDFLLLIKSINTIITPDILTVSIIPAVTKFFCNLRNID